MPVWLLVIGGGAALSALIGLTNARRESRVLAGENPPLVAVPRSRFIDLTPTETVENVSGTLQFEEPPATGEMPPPATAAIVGGVGGGRLGGGKGTIGRDIRQGPIKPIKPKPAPAPKPAAPRPPVAAPRPPVAAPRPPVRPAPRPPSRPAPTPPRPRPRPTPRPPAGGVGGGGGVRPI